MNTDRTRRSTQQHHLLTLCRTTAVHNRKENLLNARNPLSYNNYTIRSMVKKILLINNERTKGQYWGIELLKLLVL